MSSALHVHSHYSLLDGYATPEENLKRASDIGLKALAVTEHGNQYSWCYYDKLHSKYPNVKIIYGVEFYECFDMNVKDKDNKYFHLIVLARNENGRKAINKLVTASNFKGFYFKPRIDLHEMIPYANDLIVTSACLASKLSIESDYNKCIEYVHEYKKIFPYFYLEMQSHSHKNQSDYNKKIFKLSKETNTPYIITTDSHAATKDDLKYQEWHVKIAHDTETASEIYEGCYLQTDEEIHKIMDDQIGADAVTKGLEETDRVADLVDEIHMPFQAPQLPSFPLPEEFEDNYSYLKYLINTGWVKRGFDKLSEEEQKIRRERIDYELDIIHSMGFDGYFLIVWDFINFARENGIPIGAGRGSCAGSLVCYTITITDLDPIKYGLIFERFLNPERISMPDTDTDVGSRDEIIQYLIDKYGENRVCQIINFSYITPIVAIKDVGKVLGFNYHEMDKLSKKFVYDTIEECLDNNPELASNPRYEELFDVALHIAGRVKTVSSHAGGVGIVDTDISDYMAMKLGTDGEHVIQVDKRIVEEIGIIKFDILGVATLNTVKEATVDANLTEFDVNINNPNFEMDDGAYELLRSAMTNGVFQVESAGMKDLLIRLQVSNMEELAAVLALYRPDAMDVLEEFIEYKHHPEKITYIHSDMEPILKETYGCMIYQEQLLDIVRTFGGRSYGGADLFRKAIGKKNIELVKSESKKLYYEIIENGYSEEIAKQISETLSQKGGYLFNKSHAYSYAVLCLQTAFLKKHYSLCFFKALLNRNKDKTGMVNKYILDAKAFKVSVLPPNLNKSIMNFSIYDTCILFGLSAISGIGEKIAKVILADREQYGKFTGFKNFCERINPSKSQVIQLIKAGAIPTKNKRKTLIQYLKSMYQPTTFKPVAKAPSYTQLLVKWGIDPEDYRIGKKKYDYNKEAILKAYNDKKYELYKEKEKERFQKFINDNQKYLDNEQFWEFEALHIFIHDNPFEEAYKYMSRQFNDVPNGDMCTIVGVIANIQKKKDKNKKTFAYVNIYSSFGLTEAILWHSTLKEYEDIIVKGNQIAMYCKKDSDEKVIARKIKPYKQWVKDIQNQRKARSYYAIK